jgi:hypothetical protein
MIAADTCITNRLTGLCGTEIPDSPTVVVNKLFLCGKGDYFAEKLYKKNPETKPTHKPARQSADC